MLNKNISNNYDIKAFIAKKPCHGWHLVTPSPWPFAISVTLWSVVSNAVLAFYGDIFFAVEILYVSFLTLCVCIWYWVSDVELETCFEGILTPEVRISLKIGVILFIVSEVMFFLAFFWAGYHFILLPAIEIGSIWPPLAIQILDTYGIPLFNTFTLLLSGAFATWGHMEFLDRVKAVCINNKYILNKKRNIDVLIPMYVSVLLAVLFLLGQVVEYVESSFNISDGVYGSIFFMATGFHGFHVMIGGVFLAMSIYRISEFRLTQESSIALDFAIWYWHFVDVVWLFLFLTIYWGSLTNYLGY